MLCMATPDILSSSENKSSTAHVFRQALFPFLMTMLTVVVLTLFRLGEAKRLAPASFSSVASANVGISPQIIT